MMMWHEEVEIEVQRRSEIHIIDNYIVTNWEYDRRLNRVVTNFHGMSVYGIRHSFHQPPRLILSLCTEANKFQKNSLLKTSPEMIYYTSPPSLIPRYLILILAGRPWFVDFIWPQISTMSILILPYYIVCRPGKFEIHIIYSQSPKIGSLRWDQFIWTKKI